MPRIRDLGIFTDYEPVSAFLPLWGERQKQILYFDAKYES
jgi:hypothetical protein